MTRVSITVIGVWILAAGVAPASVRPNSMAARKGVTYYVDATRGSDHSSGLSPRVPWRTIAKVNATHLSPDDSVLFKRGEVWREQLIPQSGDKAGHITYGAYGKGSKPLLLGSVSRNRASDWTDEGGNIWTTSSIPVDVGCIIFDHGASVGTKVWSRNALARQGDFWYDGPQRAVAMYSASDPASRYSDIECALTRHIINEGGKSYVIYESLDLRCGAAHGIGGGDTHHIIARHCDLSFIGGGHQFTTEDGRPVRYGNGIEFWAGAHDNLVEECRLWEIYDAALTNQGFTDNAQVNIRYRNNVIWNCEYSFEYWNGKGSITDHIYFENNTCVNAGHGWGHRQRPDPSGRHLMFYNNQAKTTHFYVRGNVFYQTPETTYGVFGISGGPLMPQGANGALPERGPGRASTLPDEVRLGTQRSLHDLPVMQEPRQCCLALANDWSSGLVMDHNCWYQPSGIMIRWVADEYAMDRFADYRARTGQDEHSIAGDPLFVSMSAHDFRPAARSPVCHLSATGSYAGALPCRR